MALTEYDFVQDEVCDMEEMVVNMFRKLCDSGGKETQGTELKAAPMLSMLAKIYELRTNHKKLNMTRSAALYNAAIVRDPENQRFTDELKDLCSAVLVKANAAKRDADLLFLSSTVKTVLQELRKDFGKRFSQLKIIPYGLDGDQLIKLQTNKILAVKTLQRKVTRKYIQLMRFISDECIKIMGAPPCKYAVVGLGSLARSEITLYSDFEHIIVLDNDVAKLKMKDRKIIMKYFRWFTTIFNIILINLGETMLNCVAIPSINPRYRDWFTDIVTPNGVTFDGMVAHACMRPLGRPATKNKPWNIEFIKPVDEMIQYLDSKEQLKEGYHVADALSKACFVAGDEVICAEYQEKAHIRIKENDENSNFSIVSKQMKEDLDKFYIMDQQFNASVGLQNFNIKKAIYRGATIFVSTLSRFYSLPASSCFDIINEINKVPEFNEEVAYRLSFMVAVACEVRAKVYHSKGQQDDINESAGEEIKSTLIKIVGKQSLVSFTEALSLMQDALISPSYSDLFVNNVAKDTLALKANMKPLLFMCWSKNLGQIFRLKLLFEDDFLLCDLPNNILKLHVLNLLNFRKDAISLIQKVIPTLPQHEASGLFYNMAIQFATSNKETDLALKLCSKLNQLNIKPNRINQRYYNPTAEARFFLKVQELESIVDNERQPKVRIEPLIQELNEMVEKVEATISMTHHLTLYCQILRRLDRPQLAQQVFEKILKIEADWKNIPFQFHILSDTNSLSIYTGILLWNGKYREAMTHLNKIKQRLEPHKKAPIINNGLLHCLIACCYFPGRYYEAFISGMESVRNFKRHGQIMGKHSTALESVDLMVQTTQKIMKLAFKILCYQQKLKLLKGITTATNVHRDLNLAYAESYHITGRHYESLICWLDYARVCNELTQPMPDVNKSKIKNLFHSLIVLHYRNLFKPLSAKLATSLKDEKPTEALKLLVEAKQWMQNKNIPFQYIYYFYVIQHFIAGRYYEAFMCLFEYVRICKKLKEAIPDKQTNFKQITKEIFHHFIFCHAMRLFNSAKTLMISEKHTEALKLLDEAKQSMQPYQITPAAVHTSLYELYGACYSVRGFYCLGFIYLLSYGRIRKRNNFPIDPNNSIRKAFFYLLFGHSMKLCESAPTLMNSRKFTEAFKQLDQVNCMLQPYKKTPISIVIKVQLYNTYAYGYFLTHRYYKSLIYWMVSVRICKKRNDSIPDVIKQSMKRVFRCIRLLQINVCKLCNSATIFLKNGHFPEAFHELDEAKRMLQLYNATHLHMDVYLLYNLCYYHVGRYCESFICLLEYARICHELNQPIPDHIKQKIRRMFHNYKYQHHH